MVNPLTPTEGNSVRVPKNVNALLTLGLLSLVAVLLIPLPTFVLDLLITANVTVSLLILMATLGASRPHDISTFPTVILLTAMLRLSLNVASTRLILLQGDAGAVVRAFGQFVVGGSYVVGIVVFLILVVIQFAVITKGQNRIAEVAARFTLDAMPGKQMAIDADLNAGVLSNEEAKARRHELGREAEFYGAMDGAGKFIRGDAVAGLIITGINIIGGILLGTIVRGMDIAQAAQTYTVLTIGDGLVSQIPGLIVSVGSGILVTKAASREEIGSEMYGQLLGSKTGLRTSALTIIALGLVPGLPTVPFVVMGGGLLLLSVQNARADKQASEADEEADLDEEDRIRELLQVDRLGIEIGYRLVSIVEPGKGGGLLEHIGSLRRRFASTLGIVLPPVRVRDNIQIEPNTYRILLAGHPVATGELRAGHFLAMDPTGTARPIDGVDGVEPAFGMPAKWITESQKEQAEVAGHTVIEAPSVLVTHLTEIIKRYAHEIVSREDVQALLDNSKGTAPVVVEELAKVLSTSAVQRVLAALLKENVPVRNLPVILEALGDLAQDTKETAALVEAVRSRVARAIAEPLLDPDGVIWVATIQPHLESQLLSALTGQGNVEVLPEGLLATFVDRTAAVLAQLVQEGHPPVLLTRAPLRPYLAEAVIGAVPGSAVLSYQEAAAARDIKVVGQVAFEGAAA